jgi:hypothetical protein
MGNRYARTAPYQIYRNLIATELPLSEVTAGSEPNNKGEKNMETTTPKYNVTVQLTGNDGNAFAIMANVTRALRQAGASADDISAYQTESMSGDYDNLLRTAMKWVNVE